MLDEVDDLVMNGFSYKGKHVKSIVAGDVDLDKSGKAEKEETQKKYQKLIDLIKERARRPGEGRAPLGKAEGFGVPPRGGRGRPQPADGEDPQGHGPGRARQQEDTGDQPRPPLFAAMNEPLREGQGEPGPQGVRRPPVRPGALLEGSRPKDPAAFARSVARLMVEGLKRE